MRRTFVQVDYPAFETALRWSHERNQQAMLSNGANHAAPDVDEAMAVASQYPDGEVIELHDGLAKGLYVHSRQRRKALIGFQLDRPMREPLHTYHGVKEHDVAISYSSEDRDGLAVKLHELLASNGVRSYFIDVAKDPGEPLAVWAIRYWEALFYSHYFVPLLTEHYLRRAGSTHEAYEAAALMRERRSQSFFYPTLPFARTVADLQRVALSGRGEEANRLDRQGFDWLRTHVFPVSYDRGEAWLVRFFRSLARCSRGDFDPDFFHCLAPHMRWLDLQRFDGRPSASIFLESELLTQHQFMINDAFETRFVGVHEPLPSAIDVQRIRDPAGLLFQHLRGETQHGPDGVIVPEHQLLAKGPSSANSERYVLPRVRALLAHDAITHLGVDVDGTTLLVGQSRRLATYSLRTGEPLFERTGHDLAAAISPTDKQMFITDGQSMALVDLEGRTLCETRLDRGSVTRFSWSSDGTRIVLDNLGTVHVFLAQGLKELGTLRGRLNQPFDFDASVDGTLIAVGSIPNLSLWDVNGPIAGILERDTCYSVRFDPTSTYCAGAFFNDSVAIFDTMTMDLYRKIDVPGPAGGVVWLSPDELLVRYRYKNDNKSVGLLVWNTKRGTHALVGPKVPWPCCMAVASKARIVILAAQASFFLHELGPL